jgi:TonB family protein
MNMASNFETALGFLAACALKSTVLFVLACALVTVLHKQSAATRHRVWAMGILSALALPACTLLLPAWHSAALGSAASLWVPASTVAEKSGSENLTAMIVNATTASPLIGASAGILVMIWAVGSTIFVSRLAGGLIRLARESARAKQVGADQWLTCASEFSNALKIARPVRLAECGNPLAMPFTWGIFRPLVILPVSAQEWPETRRRVVLLHEFAHIARCDWLLQMCAELVRSFYWFHPLAWMAARNMRQESERACDDAVLNSGVNAAEYARQLLDLARTVENAELSWSTGFAVARPSTLERRFAAMLNPSIRRRGLSPRARLLAALAALCLLLMLATLQLPAQNLSGKFTGTIYDPSRAAVPNATVIMSNEKSGTIEMTASDADGNFKFAALAAGEYEMKVLKPGFQEYKAPQVVLAPGRESSHSLTLNVGTITEEVDVVAEGTAKALPAGTARNPARIRLGGDIQAARLLNKVQPLYPAAARAAGIQGTVILHAVIGMDGKPLSLRIMNIQADPELARAAVEAVSQWRYQPTLLNRQPIEVDTTINVNFSLLP